MKRTIQKTSLAVSLLLFTAFGFTMHGQEGLRRFRSNGNPIVTHKFTADPAALVLNDTLWVFTGEDLTGNQKGYKMKNWCVFSTTDLKNWTEYPIPLTVADFAWDKPGSAYASHVVPRNDKYYWYVSTNAFGVGVAVSDRPEGPYKDALGKPLLTNDDCFASTHSWACIDPAVFIDDDGTAWIFWGNRECYYAKLKDNMIEIDGDVKRLEFKNFDFTEAPWIHKYNGKYYLTYASGFPEKISYATADKIDGPYEYKGILNEMAGNSNTNHQSIVEFKGDWYFVYHNGAHQNGGGSFSRSVCIDRLYHNPDGTIKRVVMTTEGPPTLEYKSGIEKKDLTAYLFAYFTGGKDGEAVRFAVSTDGYNYFALNNNKPVLDSKKISSAGGLRDPHILRSEDDKTFYMVATDMMSSKGWDSNRAMVLMKSTDLVNWTSQVVNIQTKYPGNEDLKRVWAPQTIFDKNAGKYMIYWSMQHGDGPDIIYYAYANADFTDLETEPKQLFKPKDKKSCIDGDIIYKDGLYYLFYKTEGHGDGIKLATSRSLTWGEWEEKEGYKQQTRESVEGSGVFKLNNSDTYIMMYDVYRKGEFHFTGSEDLENFSSIDNKISMDFKPRHGSIVSITNAELRTLINRWGKPEGLSAINRNPVIPGYYADPEIIYSHKNKKYYLYPTSDGFLGWGGYYFKTFSSDNLVDWKDEGVILDLKKDVPWAGRNAWAPTIIEKELKKGQYKYYYYFSGAQKIGVAVSDEPAGPFVDSGQALVDWKPQGINRGQEIDPDVFRDPVSGKYYLYWGNGYMAVAELNDDMVSIKKETLTTFSIPHFREAIEVFYRNGMYYFLYSENDTRSEDYRVRYGMSKSPTGPIEYPEDNLILSKVPEKGIYGTGHNSALQIPKKDEWYIVYHRFSRPNGILMGQAAGFHREVCMDKMEFNADGTIRKIVPTL